MADWLGGMSGLTRAYTLCAIIGGIFFLIRVVLQFFGGDADVGDLADAADAADAGDALDGMESDVSFRFFSIQGLAAFLMIFGLTGRALLLDIKVPEVWSFVGALFGGFCAMGMVGGIFWLMRRLESSGNIKIANAVGQEGTVYLHIPPGGEPGQVTVVIQGRQRQVDAICHVEQELPTGSRVKVVAVTASSTLVVEPLE